MTSVLKQKKSVKTKAEDANIFGIANQDIDIDKEGIEASFSSRSSRRS
jgi:hypothetical protein